MTSEPPPSRPPLAERPELPAGVTPPPDISPARRRRDALPHWPPWTPVPALLLAFVIALFGTLAIAALVELAGREVDATSLPPGVTLGGAVIQGFALIGTAVLFARVTGGAARLGDFGIRSTAPVAAVGWIALTWFAFLAFSAAWAALFDITESGGLPAGLGRDDPLPALIGLVILATVVAPVAEEFFFRGFFFTALRRSFGVAAAAIITGAVFGAIHAGGTEPQFLVPLGVFGVLLCLLYWRTGSIIPCMVLHALNNSVAVGVSLEWNPAFIVALMIASNGLIVVVALLLARRSRPAAPVAA